MSTDGVNLITPETIDPVLQSNINIVDSFAYVTFDITAMPNSQYTSIKVSDRARITELTAGVLGVTPFLYDAALTEFLKKNYYDKSTGLNLAEQLYTARGTQGAGVGTYVASSTSTNPKVFNETFIMSLYGNQKNVYYQVRPIFTLD